MTTFNPSTFSAPTIPVADSISYYPNHTHASHDIKAMTRRSCGTLVVHNSASNVTMVIAYNGDGYLVTHWYNIDPAKVWASVNGKVEFNDLFNEAGMSWDGGGFQCSKEDIWERFISPFLTGK